VESIGEKLKYARETRKLTIKDVVKDTNISPVYLEALEDEEFEKFPSETYLIGFLKSYSEFLKLNSEEMIQLYRGYKIGESVTPLEELTKPTRQSMATVLASLDDKYKKALYLSGLFILVVIAVIGIKSLFTSDADITESNSVKNIRAEYHEKNLGESIGDITNLHLNNDKSIVLVSRKEAVQFMVGNREIVFLLEELDSKSVTLKFLPEKITEKIEMGKPRKVSLDGCPRDIIFTLKGLTENRAKIKVLLGKKTGAKEAEIKEKIKPEKGKTQVVVQDNTQVVAQDKKNLKIIFEARFTQKSFIELYLDGSMKKRGFIPSGSVERWEASEYIQIKIGNAGGLKARINGKKYKFGKSGQIANKVITWKRSLKNPNQYNIVVKDW